MMHKSADVTRRFALKAGVGSVLALGLTPGTAGQSDEDPAEIIPRIAGDAFNLFGHSTAAAALGSRRAWARDVTRLRFATKDMAVRAGGAFLREFDDEERNLLCADRAGRSRVSARHFFGLRDQHLVCGEPGPSQPPNTATIMETTVVAQGTTYRATGP